MNKKKTKPPRFIDFLMKRLLSEEDYYQTSGDFEEAFNCLNDEKGLIRARLWYWTQFLKSIPDFFELSIYGSISMLKNYLKIALRNLYKYKIFSIVNISGLTLGIACCLLISLQVQDEFSFDKFHKNADRIYKVTELQHYSDYDINQGTTPAAIGPALKADFPEIVEQTRYKKLEEILLRYDNKAHYEIGLAAVDSAFFNIFTFDAVKGKLEDAFRHPNSMVICESIAEKYFSGIDPVGKTMQLNNKYDFTVTAVIKDVPDNSSIKFDIALPWDFMNNYDWYDDNS